LENISSFTKLRNDLVSASSQIRFSFIFNYN
jgi:hypothetical protein